MSWKTFPRSSRPLKNLFKTQIYDLDQICHLAFRFLYRLLYLPGLWDVFQTKRTTVKEGSGELTFVDDVEQVKEVPDEASEIEVGSPVVSSGGVTLKQTFNLAREDAIAYIRAVSF